MDLAEGRVQCRDLANTTTKFRVLYNTGNSVD